MHEALEQRFKKLRDNRCLRQLHLDSKILSAPLDGEDSKGELLEFLGAALYGEVPDDGVEGIQWIDYLHKEPSTDIHDRFAIVDNELWHFGADVGGAHLSINAASRGWNAEERGAVRFFDNVWKYLAYKRNG